MGDSCADLHLLTRHAQHGWSSDCCTFGRPAWSRESHPPTGPRVPNPAHAHQPPRHAPLVVVTPAASSPLLWLACVSAGPHRAGPHGSTTGAPRAGGPHDRSPFARRRPRARRQRLWRGRPPRGTRHPPFTGRRSVHCTVRTGVNRGDERPIGWLCRGPPPRRLPGGPAP